MTHPLPFILNQIYAKIVNKNCDVDDMPLDAISRLEIKSNHMPHIKESFVDLDTPDFDDGEIYTKMSLDNNTAVSLCDCDKEKYKMDSEDKDNDKIMKKLALKSKCQAMVEGQPLFGTRENICERGIMPETTEQMEERIR